MLDLSGIIVPEKPAFMLVSNSDIRLSVNDAECQAVSVRGNGCWETYVNHYTM